MAVTTPKKRNPQDTTLRNVRAANARLKELDAYVTGLYRYVKRTNADVNKLSARVSKLEAKSKR